MTGKRPDYPSSEDFHFYFLAKRLTKAPVFMGKAACLEAGAFSGAQIRHGGGPGHGNREVDTEQGARALPRRPPPGGGSERRARDPGVRVREEHPGGKRTDPLAQPDVAQNRSGKGSGKKRPGEE